MSAAADWHRWGALTVLGALSAGCAGAPAPEAEAPEEPPPGSHQAEAPTDVPAEAPRLILGALLPEVPAAPDDCPAAGPLPSRSACSGAQAELSAALQASPEKLDTALASLETCSEFEPGMIRVLRAERAPRCADTLVLPLVGSHAARQEEVPTHVRATLVGLGLAARLRRTVVDPPKSPNVESRGELEAYFAEQLFPWATEQSKAIFQMAREGSLLSGYARGVVAIEAGMADMRFVEMAREVPIPREMREDPEVAEIYYATLDEALEPRKNRGRDAALVGLAELSRVGIASSQRLDAARALIARVFAGNRMMALDSLVLPELPPCSESSDEEQIATRVESAHVAAVLSKKTPSRELSACLLHRGLPLFLERSLTSSTLASDHALLGRGHFELGRTYFDAERFQKAEAALSRALDAEEGGPSLDGWAQASFFRSLAVALAAGPRGPVDLFRYGSRLPRPLGDLTLLDAVASATTELSPLAMFDGALLRELAPEEGSPAFWQDLAKRYEVAGQGLEGTDRKEARARALAAKQTATELRKRLN